MKKAAKKRAVGKGERDLSLSLIHFAALHTAALDLKHDSNSTHTERWTIKLDVKLGSRVTVDLPLLFLREPSTDTIGSAKLDAIKLGGNKFTCLNVISSFRCLRCDKFVSEKAKHFSASPLSCHSI